MTEFEKAHDVISELAKAFRAHESKYLSPNYQEVEVRKDFIDKFWKALGWDVDHDVQKNPYEQEVKVERGQEQAGARKRSDYAFSLAPNFRDVPGHAPVTLAGALPDIVRCVHAAHEKGFPRLSTKDDGLLRRCGSYRYPSKAFYDLGQSAAYKVLFDTSRRGFIALRGFGRKES